MKYQARKLWNGGERLLMAKKLHSLHLWELGFCLMGNGRYLCFSWFKFGTFAKKATFAFYRPLTHEECSTPLFLFFKEICPIPAQVKRCYDLIWGTWRILDFQDHIVPHIQGPFTRKFIMQSKFCASMCVYIVLLECIRELLGKISCSYILRVF